MNNTDANQNRYTQTWRIAGYLESEWSDFLLDETNLEQSPGGSDPLNDRAQPNFYKQIGEFTRKCTERAQMKPVRYCDIGGSTGRTLYEINKRFPDLDELFLVEPSPLFCTWATKMLVESTDLGWIPIVKDWTKPSYQKATSRPHPISKEKGINIHIGLAEDVPRPREYFDLITCLNVVDRHNHPVALIDTLSNLLSSDGLLVLASPLEFEEEFTPDKQRWVTDLNVLLPKSEWTVIDEENFFYDFRYYSRRFIRYNSQVIAARKRNHGTAS